jgi:hypothetical protein
LALVNLLQFDPVNRMIPLTIIPLSDAHCIKDFHKIHYRDNSCCFLCKVKFQSLPKTKLKKIGIWFLISENNGRQSLLYNFKQTLKVFSDFGNLRHWMLTRWILWRFLASLKLSSFSKHFVQTILLSNLAAIDGGQKL